MYGYTLLTFDPLTRALLEAELVVTFGIFDLLCVVVVA